MKPVIAMTVIGDLSRRRELAAAPPGYSWHFVADEPFAAQVRAILRLNARAVVAWIGPGRTIERGTKLIERLLAAGVPVVVAIAEAHHPEAESRLRQAGAFYLCANEAGQGLSDLLESILGSRSPPDEVSDPGPARRLRLDAG